MLPEQNVLGKKSGISGWWCVNEVTHPTRFSDHTHLAVG
jgi:lipopolysaccharide/colanic/teichoic acid biosynthesis glycosyltransferase